MNQYKECTVCNKIIINNEYHTCDTYKIDPNDPSNILSIRAPSNLTMVGLGLSNLHHSDYNIFGVDKTKIIEKLEEDLSSEKISASSARNRYETTKNEKIIFQKKNIRLEKKIKKITRERSMFKIELKISKDINRNLLNRLDDEKVQKLFSRLVHKSSKP